MGLAGRFAIGRADRHALEREAPAAVAIAAGLYLVGALLTGCALLLPDVASPAGVVAVALDALLSAALLFYAAERAWGGLWLAFAADMWGVVVIAVLCASGGGAGSPFALIYFFAIGHAAAFQPRGRVLVVCAAGLIAYLAPVLYETRVGEGFWAVACVGIVLALLTSAVVHLALARMREQRRRLEILITATAELDKSLDPAETLQTIAHMAVPELAAACLIDLLDDGGAIATTVAVGTQAQITEQLERAPAPERLLREEGYVSAAVFPMLARERTQGVISFWTRASAGRYDAGMLAVLEDLTGRAAMALDNARLYAERARVARTLRRGLIPSVLPSIPGIELASYFRPMGAGEEVGGDFYDAFGDRDSCWLVVGDVCGKGAEAAALTGFLRHTTAAYAREESHPARVLEQVNRAMLDQDFDGRFATAILAHLRFGAARAHLTLAAAGHPLALLARADGTVCELGASGTLLGIFPDPRIEEVSTVLEPGDAFALYTDGLAEAHAPGRIITVQEMIEELARTPPARAQAAIDALLRLIDVDGGVLDDIAILAARVSPPSAPTPIGAHSTRTVGSLAER